MNSEQLKQAALKAGAARFYPDKQRAHADCYIVSKQFLERYAEEIRKLVLAETIIEQPDVVMTDISADIKMNPEHPSYYRGMAGYE